MDIWSLPQELRDIIYEIVLKNGDRSGPSRLPVRLDLVCKRIRSETRRLYHNKTIRATVLERFWTPYPLGKSDYIPINRPLFTITSKIWIKIPTPKNANYRALTIALYMPYIMRESCRRFAEGEVEPRSDSIGLDSIQERMRNQEVASLFEEALEELGCLADHEDWEQETLVGIARCAVGIWLQSCNQDCGPTTTSPTYITLQTKMPSS